MQRNSIRQRPSHRREAQEVTSQRLQLIRRHLARIRYDDISFFATAGSVEYGQFFMVVCESVEQIVNIFYDFLLELHKATCRLLRSSSQSRPAAIVTRDLKPLPDLLRDLHTSKMTLCNSGPDVIPVTSRNFSDNCTTRKRSQNREPVHSIHDLNDDTHKCDNRHYYHRGHSNRHHHQHHHQHHHHQQQQQSRSSRNHHGDLDDADNIINNNNSFGHQYLGYDMVDGSDEAETHNDNNVSGGQNGLRHSDSYSRHRYYHYHHDNNNNNNNDGNNNVVSNDSTPRPNLVLPRIAIDADHDNNSSHAQPAALPINIADANGNHDNNENGNHGNMRDNSRGRLMVPGSQARAHLRQPSPRRSSRDRSISPRRRLSHDRRDAEHANHDVDHEIAIALRSIGDNLDVRMRNHKEPSVQAVFGAPNITFGQILVMALRHHNVVGVTIGATLELLLQYSRQ